jgi:transposase
MARPYSLDLRERVVASVTSGKSCRTVAALFDVSVASVVKWSQRARSSGSPAAKPMGGKRPYVLAGERDWLLARLAEKPDLTLHALLEELRGRRRVVVACDTLWRFLRREGISFKKNRVRQRAGPA